MSAYRAAKVYSVPPTTLRDRISGRVATDARVGHETIFTSEEEDKLYQHITYMADIGFGYNKTAIQYMAKDFADSLGKSTKGEKLSDNWFYGFTKRKSDLKTVKPQKLSIPRAKSASRETLDNYYKELEVVLSVNNIKDKPWKIFNIDETGVNTEHSPPKIVCKKDTVPQNITSSRSATVTVIAAGNAAGQSIPPYYVFPGVRWNEDFLKGSPTGSAGEMSKTGWSNSTIFFNYLTKHFLQYVTTHGSEDPTLILYDGHRSHISLTLTEWARQHNIILFVLPPHSSHLTQPLDVGIFGPFKKMYSQECQKYMKLNPGINITKYDVSQLTSKPYLKALTPENLISAFRRTGIYPFSNTVISDAQVAPAIIYECHDEIDETSVSNQTDTQPAENTTIAESVDFFSKRTITKAVKPKPKKFVPPFKVCGNLLQEKNTEILTNMDKSKSVKQDKQVVSNQPEARPSTSGLGRKGGPIPLDVSEDTGSESDEGNYDDDEKCCVCNKWQPADLEKYPYIAIVSWGKCDKCAHWTHLRFCCKVRTLRRNSEFICPHCESSDN